MSQAAMRALEEADVWLKPERVHFLQLDTLDDLDGFGACEACILGKHKRAPFPADTATRATEILALVHSDLCGPFPTSIGGKTYFLSFIDDFTRFCVIYFLKHKSETFGCFQEFKAWSERQTGHALKMLRSDNGGEYIAGDFAAFCSALGIACQFTTARTPQQNGVSENKNQALETSASSMLQYAKLPKCYWAEAIAYATYIQNRIPHRAGPCSMMCRPASQHFEWQPLRLMWCNVVHPPVRQADHPPGSQCGCRTSS